MPLAPFFKPEDFHMTFRSDNILAAQEANAILNKRLRITVHEDSDVDVREISVNGKTFEGPLHFSDFDFTDSIEKLFALLNIDVKKEGFTYHG